MTDPAAKSFEIRTARQYLDELLRPADADFLKDVHSSRKATKGDGSAIETTELAHGFAHRLASSAHSIAPDSKTGTTVHCAAILLSKVIAYWENL